MRTLYPVLIVVVMFIGLGIWSANYLDTTASNLSKTMYAVENAILQNNWQAAKSNIDNLNKSWSETRNWWAIIIDHSEIDNIEVSLTRLKQLIKTKATSQALAEVAELKKLLEHIPEKEKLNIKNIL